jgi:hypothetical protein
MMLDRDHPRVFVPEEFTVPRRLETPLFVLEPLGPRHNHEDYAAWSTSIEHIRGTPGWEGSSWPRPMTPEDNRRDLEMHARHFESREGFTYTVIDRARVRSSAASTSIRLETMCRTRT